MSSGGVCRAAPATPGLLNSPGNTGSVKPTAQATCADPSRCNSANRQNSPIKQKGRSLLTNGNDAICMSFDILNALQLCNIVFIRPSVAGAMHGRGLVAAISKGHIGLFLTFRPRQLDILTF